MLISRVFRLLQADRHLMIWSILFGLLFTGLGIVPPLLMRTMIRWIQAPELAGSFFLLGSIIAGVYLLRGITRYVYGLCSHVAAYRVLHRLMNRVYQHLQLQSPAFVSKQHSGQLVARTVGDVEAVEDFIAHGIPETMLAIVIPIAMSVVLFVIHWKLALIALLPLPVMAVVLYVIKTRTRNRWKDVRARFAGLSGRIQDNIGGLRVIQSFNQEAAAARQVEEESRQYRDAIIHANVWSLVPAGLIEAISGAGLVLIVWSGGWMSGPGGIDVADLVVFLMSLGYIFQPLLRLASYEENLQKAAASAERVFSLLETPPALSDDATAEPPADLRYHVEFDQVTFGYEPGQPVLRDVSFQVDAGETVALVGVTGVGKSTACHLLVRFFDPDEGTVRLGGHDLRTLPLDFLRRQVALVSQDVFLFEGTIRENLLIGNPQASDEELRAAVEAANAAGFIDSFPEGLETRVGERGVRLSGGQKQRIAIARALLKDAPVLVLDEATSAVDAATENEIREAVMRATEGRTVIVIAHRLSTIMAADRIIVMDEGRIIENGRYDELVAADGHFTRLCRVHENRLLS